VAVRLDGIGVAVTSVAAFASMVTTIGRLSDIIASPKSAKISGGIGLPPPSAVRHLLW
jgi:hypothetical protein